MKANSLRNRLLCALVLVLLATFSVGAQTILINHQFNVTALPAGVTSSGTVSPTKAADPPCTQGMIQVNSGGYLQVDIPSCGVIWANMKSTASSARVVALKYKKKGDVAYTTVSPNLSVATAANFPLSTTYPVLVTQDSISIRLEPTSGNIQIHDLYAEGNATQSSAAEITAFMLPQQIGQATINSANGTIGVQVPLGTNLSSVVPQVLTISNSATVNPQPGQAQNFANPVVYTVTAQNNTTKTWTVTTTAVASSEKEITAFRLSNNQLGNSVINSAAGTITVAMPTGSTLTSLIPVTLTTSASASVNPVAGTARDFSAPVSYTVTAQDNSTKTWTVSVSLVDPTAVFSDYEAENAQFTGAVASNHVGFSGTGFIDFLATGENSIIFTVCEQSAGVQRARFRYAHGKTDDRKAKLFVNDVYVETLNFVPTAAFTTYVNDSALVSLNAGVNYIKLTWDSTDGPNLDKLSLSGAACATYTLTVNATNGGSVVMSPARAGNRYYAGEKVKLTPQISPSLLFTSWTGDLTGSRNPDTVTMTANKTVTAQFTQVATYTLQTSISGLGSVTLSPSGGSYAAGTKVYITANTLLGSSFQGYSGAVTGTNALDSVIMNANKLVSATFTSNYTLDFEKVIGFAAAAGDGRTTPTKGGQCAPDTVFINGPSEFNKLCESLYYRQSAYKTGNTTQGMKKAPLVILLKAGVYDGTQTLSTNGAKAFGNSMLDIAEQADLTFIGDTNVVFKIGINVKRSNNLLIRNITFYDYYDDGINIGGSETHHIWVDHCTVGHPLAMPADSEHPDGGIDIKDGASFVTVSWCLVRNSWKTSLVGHSDGNGSTDNGRLKVTYVNNHFYHTNSRNPRVRFGNVHVLNNLLEQVMLYGSVAANSAQVFCENNFYLNTDWPMYADRTSADFKAVYGNNTDDAFTSKTGNYPAVGLKQQGNEYDDAGLPVITSQINPAMLNPGGRSIKFDELNPNLVFNPATSYTYTPYTAQEVKVLIPAFAGADKVDFPNSCNSVVLPAKLSSFTAQWVAAGEKAELSWQTQTEENTKAFVVERSTNGREFKAIGEVAATNDRLGSSYRFLDLQPVAGTNYYRLKMVDNNGSAVLSSVVALNSGKQTLRITPNPVVNNEMVVTHEVAKAGAQVQIIAQDGRVLATQILSTGSNRTQVSARALPAGHYFLRLQNGDQQSTAAFVKQ